MEDVKLIITQLKDIFPYGRKPNDYVDALADLNKINDVLRKELFRISEHDDYILVVWDSENFFPTFYEHLATDTTKQEKIRVATTDILNRYCKILADCQEPGMPIYIRFVVGLERYNPKLFVERIYE